MAFIRAMMCVVQLTLVALLVSQHVATAVDPPKLSLERGVIQTNFGDVEIAFYPQVAPHTVIHMISLFKTGCFDSNHFFRVDKGFVAQVADVRNGRLAPLHAYQLIEGSKTVPLEVVSGVKHHAGTLSMARSDDPNSGASSFSILLGDAPHLDMKYTVFGRVTSGMETMRKMELVKTKREGIFVMPIDRVSILGTFMYYVSDPSSSFSWTLNPCEVDDPEEETLKQQITALTHALQATREKCLPSQ